MDSTLLLSSSPFDLRAFNGEMSPASNQLGGQWGATYLLNDDLLMKEQESLPPSEGIFGQNDTSLRYINEAMADLDDGWFGTSTSASGSVTVKQLSNPSYAQSASSSPSKSSSGGINGSLPEEMAIDTSQFSDPPSPRTKMTPVKKRGRPRKARPTAGTANGDSDIRTRTSRRTSTRSVADASGADTSGGEDPRTVRGREKNRIAADKCRSRRRQEEDKLRSRHEDLEREHRRLSGVLSELMAETFVLKNMLMEHGRCDCRLIQDYLKESASDWVAKKLQASASPVGAVGAVGASPT